MKLLLNEAFLQSQIDQISYGGRALPGPAAKLKYSSKSDLLTVAGKGWE